MKEEGPALEWLSWAVGRGSSMLGVMPADPFSASPP